MFLSKRKNGVWYLWFTDGGKRQKVSCGTTHKNEALKFVQQFKASRLGEKTVDITLKKFIEEYLNYVQQTLCPKSVREYRNTLNRFYSFTGDRLLKHISIKDCCTYQTHLLGNAVKPSSANEYLAKLQCAFQVAVKWQYLSDNPFQRVERAQEQKAPPAFMTLEQIQTFLETLPEFWRGIFLFALLTGCRASELVNLRWEDLDFIKRTIQIGSKYFTTKTRKVRIIPMHAILYSMLQGMKAGARSEFVFAKANGQPYTAIYVCHVFKNAIRKLGLPEELHLHSTRHTFASLLVQSGVPIYSVSKLLGHSSVAMTQIYAHLQPETLHTAIEGLQLPR